MLFYFYAIAAALCFGSWPNVTKMRPGDWSWTAALVGTSVALVGWMSVLSTRAATPYSGIIWLVLGAGALNGLGTLFYSKGFGLAPSATELTIVVTIGVLVVSPLSEAVLLQPSLLDYLTLKRCTGITLAVLVAPLITWLMK